jgi:alanyl-tRNA synthetase
MEMTDTIKLYDEDAYAVEFTARVVSSEETENGWNVVLDRTLFFPEEGGQSPDTGVLAGLRVTDVQIRRGIITHTLERPETGSGGAAEGRDKGVSVIVPAPVPGMEVKGAIDWEKRFSNMQNHTGEHIVSGLMHEHYGFDNVGFRLSPRTPVTVDVNGFLDEEQLAALEREANEVVRRNVNVRAEYPPEEVLKATEYRSKIELTGAVRLVTVEGVDTCACCAPHVRRTGEIGLIRILDAQKTGGGMRIFLLCGERALEDLQKKSAVLREISRLTSKKQEEADAGVRHLIEENAALKAEAAAIQAELVALKAERIPTEQRSVLLFERGMDAKAQRDLVNLLTAKHAGLCVVFAGSDEAGYRFVIGSGTDGENAKEAAEKLRGALNARGGGSPQMVQGSVTAGRETIKECLSQLF